MEEFNKDRYTKKFIDNEGKHLIAYIKKLNNSKAKDGQNDSKSIVKEDKDGISAFFQC